MAQTGYTPILIYASGTATNVPLAANLTSNSSGAELALNYADGKLYFKNSSGVVTLLAGSSGNSPAAGSNTQVQYNNSGVLGASANLTFNSSTSQLVLGGGSAVSKFTVAGALTSTASESVSYTNSTGTATTGISNVLLNPAITLNSTNISMGVIANPTITGSTAGTYYGVYSQPYIGAITGASNNLIGVLSNIVRSNASDTATGTTLYGGQFLAQTTPTLNSSATSNSIVGIVGTSANNSAGLVGALYGAQVVSSIATLSSLTTNTSTTANYGVFTTQTIGTATGSTGLTNAVTNSYGFYTTASIGTGTASNTTNISTVVRVNLSGASVGSATNTANITDWHGLLYNALNVGALGTITNRWGIYIADTIAKNYFGGFVGIGQTAPAYNLDVTGTARITGAVTLSTALGATSGGTGQATYTTGDTLYASATNTLSKLPIGTSTYILTSNGTIPQWSAPSSITVSTATNLAGGVAGSVPYQSGVATTTFLGIGAANTVMTSSGTAPQWGTTLTGLTGLSSSSITNTGLTSGRLVYSTTGGLETDSASLTFDGTNIAFSPSGYTAIGGGGGEGARISINKNLLVGTTTDFTTTAVAGGVAAVGYGIYPWTSTTSTSNTTTYSSLNIENPTFAVDGSAVSGFYSSVITPKISNSGVGNSVLTNIGLLVQPKIISTGTAARIQLFGVQATVNREYAADTSTASINSLWGFRAIVGQTITAGSGIVAGQLYGFLASGQNQNGTVTTHAGFTSLVANGTATTALNTSSTTLALFNSASFGVGAASGGTATVTNAYGVNLVGITVGATGTVTNSYALYSAAATVTGTITNRYGVYIADTVAKNYFGGFVGIGNTAPAYNLDVTGTANITGAVTLGSTATITGAVTLSGGTANGVAYLNGSKALTTGATLVTDGTNLLVNTATAVSKLTVNGAMSSSASEALSYTVSTGVTATTNTSQFINSPGTLGANTSIGSLVNQTITGAATSYSSYGYASIPIIGAITGTIPVVTGYYASVNRDNASDTATGAFIRGAVLGVSTTSTLSSSATGSLNGIFINSQHNGGGLAATVTGVTSNAITGSGSVSVSATSVFGVTSVSSIGTSTTSGLTFSATTVYGINSGAQIGTGSAASTTTITDQYNFGVASFLVGSATNTATITNSYGLYLRAPTVGALGTITNRWGVYSADTVATNYFAGKVGVGTTSPAQALSVVGTVESTSGGFKFPDGSTQTTASNVYNVQTFTAGGTWTKPTGVTNVRVIAIGGGGGGGSGRKGALASIRTGGAGGFKGNYVDTTFSASDLTSTVTVAIGTGGAGGASQATNSTNGNNGTAGNDTTFGTYLTSYGGWAGTGGSTATVVAIPIAKPLTESSGLTQSTSGYANATNFSNPGTASTASSIGGLYGIFGPGGGGGGNVITAANALGTAVGYGGYGAFNINGGFAGGTASLTDGAAGAAGTAATSGKPYGGGGGGGGNASLLGNGGAGGAGALYGAGGGGGGASTDAVGNSGAGGAGADGICVVISWN